MKPLRNSKCGSGFEGVEDVEGILATVSHVLAEAVKGTLHGHLWEMKVMPDVLQKGESNLTGGPVDSRGLLLGQVGTGAFFLLFLHHVFHF